MRALDFIKYFLAVSVIATGALAQDLITMRDGSEVQAVVVDVGADAIKYKKWHYQDGPFFVVSVSKVFSIRYRNGEKDVFEAKESASASNAQHPLYFPVYVPQYTPIAPAHAPVQHVQKVKSEGGRTFVFSARSEERFGAMKNVGGLFEWGVIGANGFYFTVEISGGGIYGGGGFNFGGTINKEGTVKNVFGLTAGNWYTEGLEGWTDHYVEERSGNNYYTRRCEYDSDGTGFNFGGPFWKIMFGNRGNFDITNRWMFGVRWYHDAQGHENQSRDNGWYGGGAGWSGYENQTLNFTYSLSVGWTWTKKR
ncbi:MAG: hypothetical protein FWF51_10705 [Chitinivibrionia bacterium]|nr:hypothetical protein [Chitinivibrionia bacterium]